MKIAGRILQNRCIITNTESDFSAVYKKNYIRVNLIKKGHTNEYDIDVRTFNGIPKCTTVCIRCNIRDAVIFALQGANL